MGKLGGMVFRRYRAEVVEDQMARAAAAFDAEMKQLKDEVKADYEARKAKLGQASDLIKEALTA